MSHLITAIGGSTRFLCFRVRALSKQIREINLSATAASFMSQAVICTSFGILARMFYVSSA
jgi:hypothetical protein